MKQMGYQYQLVRLSDAIYLTHLMDITSTLPAGPISIGLDSC